MDVLSLLTKYCSQIKRSMLFDTGFGNKLRLLTVNDIVHLKGEAICSILPAFHCLTGSDTTFRSQGEDIASQSCRKERRIYLYAHHAWSRARVQQPVTDRDIKICMCCIWTAKVYRHQQVKI